MEMRMNKIMEVHKITLIVIDHDEVGADGIKEMLESTKYPNHCMAPDVRLIETVDIGEWTDEHPLNYLTSREAELGKLFPSEAK